MRRAALTALLLVLCVSTVGCQSDTDDSSSPSGAATWLEDQAHVQSVTAVPWDDGAGSYLRITLDNGLPDDDVLDVVQSIKEHFDDTVSDAPSMEVDVDGFVGSIFPAVVSVTPTDPDLERALWLRRDGRATSYGDRFRATSTSHPRVIAPAPVVARLALDYDAAVSHDRDVRTSYSVESEDGTTGVEWSQSDGIGFGIPTAAVTAFAETQERLPGTTGWINSSGTDAQAAVFLDPDDVSLDEMLTDLPSVLDVTPYTELELGWGPARAPAGSFVRVFGRPSVRRMLDRVRRIPGVVGFSPGSITVSDRSSFDATQSLLTSQRDGVRGQRGTTVLLERAPTLFGLPTDPVFTSYERRGAIDAVHRVVADLDSVVRVDLSLGSDFGNLMVLPDIDDATLRTVLTRLAALPSTYGRTEVSVVVPGAYGRTTEEYLGSALRDGKVEIDPTLPEEHDDLAARVKRVWAAVAPTTT